MYWNWHILKYRLWSNRIPVSQFFSLNLDLKEKKFSYNCINIWPLWVSTRDQSGTVLFKLNFFSKKIQPTKSERNLDHNQHLIFFFDLLFLFFSYLSPLRLYYYQQWKPARRDAQPAWAWGRWDVPTRWNVWDAKGEGEGRGRESEGGPFRHGGLLVWML